MNFKLKVIPLEVLRDPASVNALQRGQALSKLGFLRGVYQNAAAQ